jgi:hypothetical protein
LTSTALGYTGWFSALNTLFTAGNTCYLEIYELGDTSVVGIYTITNITINANYVDLTVSFFAGAGAGTVFYTDTKTYTISWVANGKNGSAGTSGSSGASYQQMLIIASLGV